MLHQGMTNMEELNFLSSRYLWNYCSSLLDKANLSPNQVQMSNNPGIICDFSCVRSYSFREFLKDTHHLIAFVCTKTGDFFAQLDYFTRFDIDSVPAGRNIMNHTGNLITIGIFDRKNLATISASDDTFSQHLSLLFEKFLQDVTNLALAIMDFTTDSC